MKTLTPESIREGIAAAETAIVEAEALIRARRAEIADLQAAQRVFDRMNGGGATSSDTSKSGAALIQHLVENPHRLNTNKWYLWEALNQSQSVWITANDAQALASELKGEEIPMSSVSPMLSDMVRADKTVLRDGLKVSLPHRSQGIPSTHVTRAGALIRSLAEGGANVTGNG